MEKGTIVLVRFPFTDYSSEKLRPALVISIDNQKETCVAFISSVVPLEFCETDYLLAKGDKDFFPTGLKKTSVFRMHKIATLDRQIILGKLGKTTPELQKKLDKKLKLLFGLD